MKAFWGYEVLWISEAFPHGAKWAGVCLGSSHGPSDAEAIFTVYLTSSVLE